MPRTPASLMKVTFGDRPRIAAHDEFERRAAAEQDAQIVVTGLRAIVVAQRRRQPVCESEHARAGSQQFLQQMRDSACATTSSAARGTHGCGEVASRRGAPMSGTLLPGDPSGGRRIAVDQGDAMLLFRRTRARRRDPQCLRPRQGWFAPSHAFSARRQRRAPPSRPETTRRRTASQREPRARPSAPADRASRENRTMPARKNAAATLRLRRFHASRKRGQSHRERVIHVIARAGLEDAQRMRINAVAPEPVRAKRARAPRREIR